MNKSGNSCPAMARHRSRKKYLWLQIGCVIVSMPSCMLAAYVLHLAGMHEMASKLGKDLFVYSGIVGLFGIIFLQVVRVINIYRTM